MDRSKDRYFVNKVSGRLNQFAQKSNDVWWSRCPICGDSKKNKYLKRFYIYQKGTDPKINVYCHNCGYSASFPQFLKEYHPDLYSEYIFASFKKPKKDFLQTKLRSHFENMKSELNIGFDIETHTSKIENLPKNHFVVQYVNGRKIPYSKVRYCPDVNLILPKEKKIPKSIPTLLIPFFLKTGEVEVFQIRFFDPKIKPKYLSFKKTDKSIKIYNLELINNCNPVYILEGPIDSMFVKNAIAMAGADLTEINLINDPIFVYDNEPRNPEINRRMTQIIKSGKKIVIWPNEIHLKDINDMVINNIQVNKILKTQTFQGLSASLAHKMWKKC